MADVEESPAQVLAPHGVDDGVDGGVEQAQHAAKGEHRLDGVVHLPEKVVNHDDEERAPTNDEGDQNQDQSLCQTQVHPGLVRPHHLHFAPLRGLDDHAPLGAAA